MRKGLDDPGYTIVEVLIVLAVTAGLFVAAMVFISGRQNSTEFTQAINDVESQIQDIANDVSTGYYPNMNNFKCTASGGSVTIDELAPNTQGTNAGCIFIGKVIQFTSGADFNVYTVVGRRQSLSGGSLREVQSLADAFPVAIAPTSGADAAIPNGPFIPNGIETRKLLYGLSADGIRENGDGTTLIGSVGFFTSFASYSNALLNSGTQRVDVVTVPTTSLTTNQLLTADAINALDTIPGITNPNGGVLLCFKSGGTGQYGVITLSGSGKSLNVQKDIYNSKPAGKCS